MLRRFVAVIAFTAGLTVAADAAPKLDKETCDQLKSEQATFASSGIAADFEKGAAWAKANLSPDRLREIEHYILLDEQLKFGCRQATLSLDVLRAGDEALKLEAKPSLDINDKDDDKDGAAQNPSGDGAKAKSGAQEKSDAGSDEKKPARKPRREAHRETETPRQSGGDQRPAAVARPKADDAFVPPASGAESPQPQDDKILEKRPVDKP